MTDERGSTRRERIEAWLSSPGLTPAEADALMDLLLREEAKDE